MAHHGVMTAAGPGGHDWVAALPAELAGQRAILHRLLDHCAADPRVRWLIIGCSLGRGAADRLSDLDLGAGVATADFDAARAGLRRAVDGLGDLVETLEHPHPGEAGPHVRMFAQYADRCQVDLVVMDASVDVGSVPEVVVLHDPGGRVTIREQPPGPVPPQQVREWAFLGWCALADLGKYLRRGSPWEALARLDEARAQLWKLQAAAAGVAQPRYGLTSILDYRPGRVPAAMTGTVAGLEPAGLLAAARQVARLLAGAGAGLDPAQRAALPAPMARYVTADLAARAAAEPGAGQPGPG
jgi:hypothetical protein